MSANRIPTHSSSNAKETNMVAKYESYELKYSRTGHPVPVIDGVHLHSIYNPIKEAEALVEKSRTVLKEKSEILLLGLGMGHHLEAMVNELSKYHGDNYRVMVIDPNERCYEDYLRHRAFDDSKVTYYIGETPEMLYSDRTLVDFLVKRPGIVSHTASFNLYGQYFKSILSYKAPKDIGNASKLVTDPILRDKLLSLGADQSISEAIEGINEGGTVTDSLDYLLLAYGNIESAKGERA